MQDDEITLFNACADLITVKKWEAFPLHLLREKQPGEWVGVRDLCLQIGVKAADLTPELFATWLGDPQSYEGYAVIVFYDGDSKWSMTAHYNRALLLGGAPPNPALPPGGSAMPASSGSTPQSAAPAAEV